MRQVRSSYAKAKFAELLDDVERGETVVITRHGRAIARLGPEIEDRKTRVANVLKELEKFRKTMPRLTVEEILSSRHEGHKY
jgi:prevent-host-death family protein